MELLKLSLHNVWDIARLSVTKEQQDFVAPNPYSIISGLLSASTGTPEPFL